jgi:hypothetical protein
MAVSVVIEVLLVLENASYLKTQVKSSGPGRTSRPSGVSWKKRVRQVTS